MGPATTNAYVPKSPNEEIVISGISGRFPECDNVEEFKLKLLEGVDLVTEDDRRWPIGFRGLPSRLGKVKSVKDFDPSFFGVHLKQAPKMDPQQRLLLEASYEAIVDAGVNPTSLRGSNTGVFVGAWQNEAEDYWKRDVDEVNPFGIMGSLRTFLANRVSYAFDFVGPSYVVDTACSSSLVALQNAVVAIQTGQCDSAIVGGCNICLLPNLSVHLMQINALNPLGKCCCYDSSANGYVRAEAVVAIYVQKASAARRVYASIVGLSLNTDGYKEQGITYPSAEMQYCLMKKLYDDLDVDLNDITYMEAHGTGTKAGDPEEANSIATFFCKSRKEPLLIGSVKSNMGHSESAAGLCSIAKVIIAMEYGLIPANLHYENPNPNIPSLYDGRLKVVTKNLPWKDGLIGINSFGIGGANVHLVLRPNLKPKAIYPTTTTTIPRLITASGRTEEAVAHLLHSVEAHQDDPELHALLDKVQSSNITGHDYRGYSILGASVKEINKVTNDRRPIWFLYSGMGSQWASMGKQMMQLDAFRSSIRKCAEVLAEQGVDLENLLMNSDEEALKYTINAFVCITSVQIALTDLLKMMGIEPDGIVGHSVGEIACAYGDGSFTLFQAIMSPYLRARALQEANLPAGKMASVGLTWEECIRRCPPGIELACHNSKDNVTVAGPPGPIDEFVKQLQSEKVFAKLVNGCEKAFHSKYIAAAGPQLTKHLEKVIPNPKKRSPKWISSSVPEANWNTPLGQTSSAAYFVNNLQSPVLFHDAVQHIPDNAIVIELAPHGLLLPILRRALGGNTIHLSLMKRDHKDNVQFFLSNIGKLFNLGHHPNIGKIYTPISFPVGRGTPMISPLVKWDHSVEWDSIQYSEEDNNFGEHLVTVDLNKDEDKYLSGHVIDGRTVFPGSGYLVLAWKTFAKLRNRDFEKMPVVFENIKFHRATFMPKDGVAKFSVNVFKGSGDFEICERGSIVASGKISIPEKIEQEFKDLPKPTPASNVDGLPLLNKDIYTEIRLRGYDYTGLFRGIMECDTRKVEGKVQWKNNWIVFLDILNQFLFFWRDSRQMHLPTGLKRVVINPQLHVEIASLQPESIPVTCYHNLDLARSGGVELYGLTSQVAPYRQHSKLVPKLETFQFIPLVTTLPLGEETNPQRQALTIAAHLVLENFSETYKINIVELPGDVCLVPSLRTIFELEPSITVDYTVINPKESHTVELANTEANIVRREMGATAPEKRFHLVLLSNVMQNTEILKNAVQLLEQPKGFLMLEEVGLVDEEVVKQLGLEVVSVQTVTTTSKSYFLLRKTIENVKEPIVIKITVTNFAWVDELKKAMLKSETDDSKIYLVAQGEPISGLVGMVNCLKLEPGGSNIRSYFLPHASSQTFNLSSPFYAAQIRKDLVHNVLDGTDTWGTLRHLPLDPLIQTKTEEVNHAFIAPVTKGDLSSFKWIQSPLGYHRSEKKAELCTVYYAPLNFRDVLLATGKLPPPASDDESAERECFLGFEFAGRDSTGRRVMGMLNGTGLATTCVIDSEVLQEVPEHWSLREAATIPIVYATCYYAMIIRGQMQPGESILIHAGAGGVGQAAISIALHMNCEVFTTVGSQSKRDFLKEKFPQLQDDHIGNSRDLSFEQLVMLRTEGRGVDLVLNSLAGEQLLASVRCLAMEGRFLEIGKIDMINNTPLGLGALFENRLVTGIALDDILRFNIPLLKRIIGLIDQGIKSGAVRPISTVEFSDDKIEQAFKLMASGKHTGKVLIKLKEEEESRGTFVPSLGTLTALSRTYMDPEKSYIVVGGLGGFGLELANWLIFRGANKIILTSRSGIKTGYQALRVRRWKENGVNVVISTSDAATTDGALRLVNEAKALGPLGGIFNLALVLHDAFMQNQDEVKFAEVAKAKINTTQNLDVSSRKLSSVEYFVVFSSVTSGRGNAGQANYGFANSAAERICESRRASGLPGLAIQWGTIGDVGYFVDNLGDNERDMIGIRPQRMFSCLSTLDIFLKQQHPVLASMVVSEKHKGGSVMTEVSIADAVGNLLGIKDIKTVSQTSTLAELGMDSLVGTEIKQTLERNYDLNLSSQEIRALTFQRLKDLYVTMLSDSKHTNPNSCSQTQFEGVPKSVLVKMSENNTKSPLFFIHSVDGSVRTLQVLAKLIDAPVYGLQNTSECPNVSINQLSQHYITHLKKAQNQGPYVIVGYSIGACVAFEIGQQLEANKEKVDIILLDGSHSHVAPKFIHHNGDLLSKQCKALAYFASLYASVDLDAVDARLKELDTFDERIAHVTEILSKSVPNSHEDIKASIVSFWDKLTIAADYKPSRTFEGGVTLIKAKESYTTGDEDYGLKSVCKQKIKLHLVDSTHETIITEPAVNIVADIIKGVIDKV